MTEEEAKTKWCPMVRDVRMTNGNLEIGSGYCKASGCMMWKIGPKAVPVKGPYDVSIEIQTGYCGLGGKP